MPQPPLTFKTQAEIDPFSVPTDRKVETGSPFHTSASSLLMVGLWLHHLGVILKEFVRSEFESKAWVTDLEAEMILRVVVRFLWHLTARETVRGRSLALGGGNIHCLTHCHSLP